MAQLVGTMQPCKEDLKKIRLMVRELLKQSVLARYVVRSS